MLDELSISGSAIVHDVALELKPGLTVLTGETGTGKTTVLTALSLLAGGKVPATQVSGERLAVEGIWSAVPSAVVDWVTEAGGEIDGELLVLRRTVSSEGRSRAFAGGASVPATTLAQLGEELTAIHGQSDQLLLRRASLQRDLLDRSAGSDHQQRVAEHREVWNQREGLQAQLLEATKDSAQLIARREEAVLGLELIVAINPRVGEDAELKQEAVRLENVDELVEATSVALAALQGSDDEATGHAQSSIATAHKALSSVVGRDVALESSDSQLQELLILVDDVSAQLRAYLADLHVEPGRLEQIQQRRSQLSDLCRRFGGPPQSLEEVIAWRTAAEELVAAPEGDELVAQLRARIDELTTRLNQLSTKISQQRTKTASQLSEAVTHELRALAMSSSSLTVDVSATTHSPTGADDVAFLLQPRADATPVPLHKGASGGELSRVMLALEVVLAGADPVGTFVFDEVDAGVGGRAAVDVGLRLSRLGQQAQVVIVTHLPQVAAFADQHFVVVRDDNESRATIVELDSSQRAGELTRMLAGLADSQAGLAHAEELLMTAGQMKAQDRA
ncbi:unannotated protein [freshwater metagenome]|uniref:DNA repair protein RecN n=1 Tax=freshwater metagenome TaxID=449393 RepID=A0A6J7EHR2_9ZZZZ|nr:DNA repair protein RecN [Actinomycetota bacterium]